jgi:hypothetical protein
MPCTGEPPPTCPHCGYCPTCGRSNQPQLSGPHWVYPYWHTLPYGYEVTCASGTSTLERPYPVGTLT